MKLFFFVGPRHQYLFSQIYKNYDVPFDCYIVSNKTFKFKNKKFELISEEEICDIYEFKQKFPFIKHDRSGWYYQQYLKMLIISKFKRNILIIDGDTYYSKSLLKEISNKKILLTTNENVKKYDEFTSILLKKKVCGKSFIANGIYIDRVDLDEAKIHKFFTDFKNYMDNQDFSEYQIIGNMQDGLPKRSAKIFRRADLLQTRHTSISTIIEKLERRGYDIIAFEITHKSSLFKKVLAHAFYLIRFSW